MSTPASVPDASALKLAGVWSKATVSNPSGECVELAPLRDGTSIAIRNSRFPSGPALIFDCETVCTFIDAAASGELDWVLEEHSRYQQLDGGGILIRGGSGETGPGGPGPFPAVGLDHHC